MPVYTDPRPDLDLQAVRHALAHPGSREAFDLLPDLVRRGGSLARRALAAIARDAHRGWIDVLLELRGHARDHGLEPLWASTLRACALAGAPEALDGDVAWWLSLSEPRTRDAA